MATSSTNASVRLILHLHGAVQMHHLGTRLARRRRAGRDHLFVRAVEADRIQRLETDWTLNSSLLKCFSNGERNLR